MSHTSSSKSEFIRTLKCLTLPVLLGAWLLSGCIQSPQEPPGFSGTQAALNSQGTVIAGQMTEVAHATRVAFDVQATVVAQQAAQLTALSAPQNEPAAGATSLPEPTALPTATATSLPTDTPEPPAIELPPTPTPTPDFEAWMSSAKILLFEDVSGVPMPRYIEEALDMLGLSFVDVKDGVGDFKAQLLSGSDWDLIVTGVEARSGVRGEFFDYLNDELDRGTSVILEMWDLDELASGKISPLLTRCGIKFQADWWEPRSDSRSIWWLVPDHPVFHEPNEGMSLAHYNIQWQADAGDFIKKLPGSEATLLAGTLAWEKESHATLATCLDGRFIIQTHSTHDYHREDVVRLWQNYIYFTLKNHFQQYHEGL
jgi:hypothetical protein